MKNTIPIIAAAAAVLILLAALVIYNYTHQARPDDLLEDQNAYMFEEPDEYFDEVETFPIAAVSPSVEVLDIILELPKDQKFNSQAPFTIISKSKNDSVVSIGKYDIQQASKRMSIPIELKQGTTSVAVILDFSYCGRSDQSLCFFRKVKLVIPITVNQAGDDKLEVKYTVES